MNRFLNEFNKKKRTHSIIQQKIIDFSKKLKNLLNVDDETLEEMVYDNHHVQYGDYLLICNRRLFNKEIIDLIEVVPLEVGGSYGCVNTGVMSSDNGWHYYVKGAAIEVLPPPEVIEKVVALIKFDNKITTNSLEEEVRILEEKKEVAIENEDYEKAYELKQKISDLKNNE